MRAYPNVTRTLTKVQLSTKVLLTHTAFRVFVFSILSTEPLLLTSDTPTPDPVELTTIELLVLVPQARYS